MTTAKETSLADLLAEVSQGLDRIEKRGKAPAAMGGFAFVQESDVVEALKNLLDVRGITLVPDVEDIQLHFYQRQGKDSPGVLATIKLAMHARKGAESVLLFRTVGQGADTQDKAPAKAITAAKKQGFLIAFSIPTGDDPERVDLDESPRQSAPRQQPAAAPAAAAPATATKAQKDKIRAKAREAGVTDEQLATIRLTVTKKQSSAQFTNADVDAMLETLADPAKIAAAVAGGELVE